MGGCCGKSRPPPKEKIELTHSKNNTDIDDVDPADIELEFQKTDIQKRDTPQEEEFLALLREAEKFEAKGGKFDWESREELSDRVGVFSRAESSTGRVGRN